jgi:hypothetical protein
MTFEINIVIIFEKPRRYPFHLIYERFLMPFVGALFFADFYLKEYFWLLFAPKPFLSFTVRICCRGFSFYIGSLELHGQFITLREVVSI